MWFVGRKRNSAISLVPEVFTVGYRRAIEKEPQPNFRIPRSLGIKEMLWIISGFKNLLPVFFQSKLQRTVKYKVKGEFYK